MPKFTIDGTLTFASQIEAATLPDALRLLRAELQGFEPYLALPLDEHPAVRRAVITEISLGAMNPGEPQPDTWLVAVDDDFVENQVLDGELCE